MVRDETDNLLDDLLSSWYRWAKGYNEGAHAKCAMFAGVRTSRQWDSENDVVDSTLHNTTMQAVDFEVGELPPVYRTAVQIQARNLVTGHNVWSSPRLPEDPFERTTILIEARTTLLRRLMNAGIC